ncbi:MAG: hypothetical protein IPJ65_29090 [Archangiaceae bacterium]|nr:hypothetical protein [Archangiaceae bacterium]
MKTTVSLLAVVLLAACGVEAPGGESPEQSRDALQTAVVDPAPGTLAPPTMQTLTAGDGWRQVAVSGTFVDADTGTPGTVSGQSLIIIDSPAAIAASPLPEVVKAELLAEAALDTVTSDPGELMWVVDEAGAGAYAMSQDPKGGTKGGGQAVARCADYDSTYSHGWNPSVTRNFSLGQLGAELQNAGSMGFTIGAGVSGALTLRIKRFWAVLGCVPYAVGFRKISLTAQANVEGRLQLLGTQGAPANVVIHRERELAKVDIDSWAFFVGPIPVVFGLSVPIEGGIDVTGGLATSVNLTAHIAASYTVECTSGGCTTTKTATRTLENNGGSGLLNARATVSPWVQASLRGYLYTDAAAYAQVGVRGNIAGDLWAYTGATCGDGDGDGFNEQVRALTLDVSAGVDLTARVSVAGSTRWQASWPVISSARVGFFDLLFGGSNAAQPMLSVVSVGSTGKSPLLPGSPILTVAGKMRPCWPYANTMGYRVLWGDGQSSTTSAAPQTAFSLTHPYSYGGTYNVRLTAQTDAVGRQVNQTLARSLALPGMLPPVLGP